MVHQQEFLRDLVRLVSLVPFQYLLLITTTLEKGVEKHLELDNLSSSEVETKVGQLLSQV